MVGNKNYRPFYVFLIKVYPEILYAAWCTLFGTRQIFEGFDGLLRAEVDDEEVRCVLTFLRLPVGTLLEIEDFIAEMVTILIF